MVHEYCIWRLDCTNTTSHQFTMCVCMYVNWVRYKWMWNCIDHWIFVLLFLKVSSEKSRVKAMKAWCQLSTPYFHVRLMCIWICWAIYWFLIIPFDSEAELHFCMHEPLITPHAMQTYMYQFYKANFYNYLYCKLLYCFGTRFSVFLCHQQLL